MLALLDTITADVVVIAHTGLEQFAAFREFAKAVPVRAPIEITPCRVPVDQIPAGDAERIAWLEQRWVLVNDRVAHNAPNPNPKRYEPPRDR